MAQDQAPIYYQQGDVPDRPSASIQPISASVPDASGIGTAIAGAAEKLQAFAQKKITADNETLALNARANHAAELGNLEQQYRNDPDWATAPQRFAAERERLMGDALTGITDPKVQAQTRLYLTVAGVASQKTVDTAALTRQQKSGADAAENVTADMQSRAAGAGSLGERAALRDAAHSVLGAAVTAGVVSAPAAEARARQFDQGVATSDVGTLIAADPATAISALHDPKTFPALDEAQRAGLFNQAYRAEWMDDHAADKAAPAAGVELAKQGGLTPEWLASQQDAMSHGWREAFGRALEPPAVVAPDPRLRADLIARATSDPTTAVQGALAGLGAGALDRQGYADIADLSQRVLADDLSRPWANDIRRDLQTRLPAGDDDARAGLRARATGQFEQWLSGNENPSQFDAQAAAIDIARETGIKAARHDVSTLPLPRFADAPRDRLEVSTLAAAADRLRAARRTGDVDEAQFVEQAELLGRWRNALQTLPKGGS